MTCLPAISGSSLVASGITHGILSDTLGGLETILYQTKSASPLVANTFTIAFMSY